MKLGEVLSLNRENQILINDSEEYVIAGVTSYGKGIVNRRTVKGSQLTMKKYFVIKRNQLMWCKVDTKNGAFGISTADHEGSLASTNMTLADIDTTKANPSFLQILFKNPFFYGHINSLSTGTTNRKYLKTSEVLELIDIPDMSLAEQDLFMQKYEDIEEKQKSVDSEISIQETLVTQLRQAILQEAIQGKLVPQDPKDEPASELLKRIKAEKEKLIKEGQIKKEKPLPLITHEEIPYDLPKGWEWVRLSYIVAKITDGEHLSPPKKDKGVFLLTAKHVQEIGVSFDDPQYVSEEDAEKYLKRCCPERDDILVCSRGTIGRNCIVATDTVFCLMGSVILIKPIKLFSPEYLNLALKSELLQAEMRGMSSATAVSALYLKDIKKALIPVPPIKEQKRIVKKVAQVNGFLKELEKKVQLSKKDSKELMQAVLQEAFAKG